MSIDSERLRDLAVRYTEAWCSQQPERVASFFSEHGSLKVNDSLPAVGREAIQDIAAGFMTAFPDLILVMDSVRIEGERAVYQWTFVGTNTGPGGSGLPVLFCGFEEWELDGEGLIAKSLGHFDEVDYQRQVTA